MHNKNAPEHTTIDIWASTYIEQNDRRKHRNCDRVEELSDDDVGHS